MRNDQVRRVGHKPEDDGVQIEWVFDDASSRNSHPQNVLLCGQIVGQGDAIDVSEITVRRGSRVRNQVRQWQVADRTIWQSRWVGTRAAGHSTPECRGHPTALLSLPQTAGRMSSLSRSRRTGRDPHYPVISGKRGWVGKWDRGMWWYWRNCGGLWSWFWASPWLWSYSASP